MGTNNEESDNLSKKKRYSRLNARGILTDKERDFLNNIPRDRTLTSRERHYTSSIENKTRKALNDLNLILETYPNPYLLFSELPHPSPMTPIIEVTKYLYYRNYQKEFSKRLTNRTKRQISKNAIRQQTRKQLVKIIDSVLNSV